jgi:uncharacterized membrane protein
MSTLVWILFGTQFVMIGSLFLTLPSFRRGMFFGVTVPVDFAQTAPGRSILQRYRIQLVCVFALCAAAGAAGVGRGYEATSLVALLAAILASVLLWTRATRDASAYRTTVPVVRSADLKPVSTSFPWLQAAAVVPLLLIAAMLWLNWSALPRQFPRRFAMSGEASVMAARTVGAVFGPVLCGLMVYALMLFLTIGMQHMRRRNQAYTCLVMAPFSWLVTLVFSLVSSIPLAMAWHVPVATTGTAIALVTVAGGLLVAVLVAITASRSRASLTPYSDTPDAGWKAGGLVYYNPADPALWVDKRLGIGRTLNFARPQSWVVLGLLLAVVAASATVASLR